MKRFSFVLLVSMLLLSGCGSKNEEQNTVETPELESESSVDVNTNSSIKENTSTSYADKVQEEAGDKVEFEDAFHDVNDDIKLAKSLVDNGCGDVSSIRFTVSTGMKYNTSDKKSSDIYESTFNSNLEVTANNEYFDASETSETFKKSTVNRKSFHMRGKNLGEKLFVVTEELNDRGTVEGVAKTDKIKHTVSYGNIVSNLSILKLFDSSLGDEYILGDESNKECTVSTKIPIKNLESIGIVDSGKGSETFKNFGEDSIYFNVLYTFNSESKVCKTIELSICNEFVNMYIDEREMKGITDYKITIEVDKISGVDMTETKKFVESMLNGEK